MQQVNQDNQQPSNLNLDFDQNRMIEESDLMLPSGPLSQREIEDQQFSNSSFNDDSQVDVSSNTDHKNMTARSIMESINEPNIEVPEQKVECLIIDRQTLSNFASNAPRRGPRMVECFDLENDVLTSIKRPGKKRSPRGGPSALVVNNNLIGPQKKRDIKAMVKAAVKSEVVKSEQPSVKSEISATRVERPQSFVKSGASSVQSRASKTTKQPIDEVEKLLVKRINQGVIDTDRSVHNLMVNTLQAALRDNYQDFGTKLKSAVFADQFVPFFKNVLALVGMENAKRKALYRVMMNADPITLIQMVFDTVCDFVGNKQAWDNITQFLHPLLTHKRLPEYDKLALLRIPSSLQIREFLVHAMNYLMTVQQVTPCFSFLFLCFKAGLVQDIASIGFRQMNHEWSNYRSFNLQKYPESNKKKRSLEWEIYQALMLAFPSVSAKALRQMFSFKLDLFKQDVLLVFSGLSQGVQDILIEFLLNFTNCSGNCECHLKELATLMDQEGIWPINQINERFKKEAGSKADISTVVNLIRAMTSMGSLASMATFMKATSLSDAVSKIRSAVSNRKHDAVDSGKLENAVNDLIEKMPPEEQTIYAAIFAIAKDLEQQKKWGVFEADDYQCYIATQIYVNPNKICGAQIPVGMGKTFILLLVLSYYRREHPTAKIRVLTSNKFLEKQLDVDLKGYLPNINVTIGTSNVPEKHEVDLMLIDEADQWLINNAVVFNNDELGGAAKIRNAKKTVMVTGTMNELLETFIQLQPRQKEQKSILKFCSKVDLTNSVQVDMRIASFYEPDIAKRKKELIQMAILKSRDGPVLIFTECSNKEILSCLKESPNLQVTVDHITPTDNLSEKRALNEQQKCGVFVLDKECARGLSIKMAKDAYVLILEEDQGFCYTLVKQMLGRGCRSFGMAEGMYYQGKCPPSGDIETYLRTKETDFEEGAAILMALYQGYKHLDQDDRVLAQNALQTPGWQTKVADLKERHPELWERLVGGGKKTKASKKEKKGQHKDRKKSSAGEKGAK